MSHLWEVFHGVAIPGEGISFRFVDPRGRLRTRAGRPPWTARSATRATTGIPCPRRRLLRLLPDHRLGGATPGFAGGGGRSLVFRQRPAFRDRGLYAAVREAYRGILPGDRLPVLYLFVTCSPREVDVNVHTGEDGGPLPVSTRSERTGASRPRRSARGGAVARSVPSRQLAGTAPAGGASAGGIAPDMSLEGVTGSPSPMLRPARNAWAACPSPSGAPRRPESGSFRPLSRSGRSLGRIWSARRPADRPRRPARRRRTDRLLAPEGSVPREEGPDAAMARPGGRRAPGSPAGGGRTPGRGVVSRRTGFSFEPAAGERIRLTGGPAALPGFDARRWWEDLCESLRAQRPFPRTCSTRTASCGGWRATRPSGRRAG